MSAEWDGQGERRDWSAPTNEAEAGGLADAYGENVMGALREDGLFTLAAVVSEVQPTVNAIARERFQRGAGA
ncbi:MAG: hypothetical protein WAP35_02170 [Solirubrobacterales bacterium]